MPKLYADIAFNLPINSLFTYMIPDELIHEALIGCRVLAPFGKRNITGLVRGTTSSPDRKNLKSIIKILDVQPVITEELLKFSEWISKYYICPIGEAIFASIPKSILIESKILYSVNSSTDKIPTAKNELQNKIIELLKTRPLTIKQISNKLKVKNIRSSLQKLTDENILVQQHITTKEKIKPRHEKFVKFELIQDFKGIKTAMLENFLSENKIKSGKQSDLLKYLIRNNISEINLKDLLKTLGTTSSTVNALVRKELMTIENRVVTREIESEFSEEGKILELNQDQNKVLSEILPSLKNNEFKAFLLFGVTGSGKTQVYIELIKEVINNHKTAIVLVPEISLTPQLIHRFKNYFGDMIGVIHSRLSEGQRFDVFRKILSGEIRIVIGARSALFAPLKNLGIIIVDEEHDHSYKQSEKHPKYNARDSAVVRARINNAVTVLGSATPSMESFYNARNGKYQLLELPHRAQKTKQPQVEIVDMLEELRSPGRFIKRETPETRFLSSRLISYINTAIQNKQSIMLLQNRRGYSAYLECQNCANVKVCPNCDITLIYHKIKDHLRCHYCGHTEKLPVTCEKCGSSSIILKGTGTEKVEEEIARLFPKARIRRMDADTVRGKDAHRIILKSFHEREFDILIGTQMISKGLDFPNVYLVGVISADIGLLNPDFRSYERTFQLLMQVAGRSGRSSDYGRVIIQTMHTDNFIFTLLPAHDYVSFYEKELLYRKNFNYPPFSRMCLIEVSGTDSVKTNTLASKLYLFLSKKNSDSSIEILKPAQALIYKLKNKFRYHIIIKSIKSAVSSSDSSYSKTEKLISELLNHIEKTKLHGNERVSIEVDPLSFY